MELELETTEEELNLEEFWPGRSQLSPSHCISFGIYKGASYLWIASARPEYTAWLLRQDWLPAFDRAAFLRAQSAIEPKNLQKIYQQSRRGPRSRLQISKPDSCDPIQGKDALKLLDSLRRCIRQRRNRTL